MTVAGQTKYEIKKSPGASDCVLIFSSPVSTLSISEKGRAASLAQGMTDAEIAAQLQTMNESLNSEAATQSQTVCSSNAVAISAYLNDAKNGNSTVNVEADLTGQAGQKTTYTTTSGQKLVCTVTPPTGQSANTTVTISSSECETKKGAATSVTSAGTACGKSEIDLGTIVGGLKIDGKYPQCCISK